MYLKTITLCLASVAFVAGGMQPQEATTNPNTQNSRVTGITSGSFFNQEPSIRRKIQDASNALRNTQSADDRAAAEQTLRELLAEDYDALLAGYETYLDQAEARIKEMRTKLQRRRDAKSDMIDLRVKVLEAEADDLGWPSKMRSNRFPGLTTTSEGEGSSSWSR